MLSLNVIVPQVINWVSEYSGYPTGQEQLSAIYIAPPGCHHLYIIIAFLLKRLTNGPYISHIIHSSKGYIRITTTMCHSNVTVHRCLHRSRVPTYCGRAKISRLVPIGAGD